jgi:ATP-dependent RNA helicase DDX3X
MPILSKLLSKLSKTASQNQPGARRTKASPLALIILPTRELGIQMFDSARSVSKLVFFIRFLFRFLFREKY